MGVTPGRLPGATVSQDKTSGVRRSVEVELVGYLLLCHEQGMRKGQGLGEDRGAEKAATKWLRSTPLRDTGSGFRWSRFCERVGSGDHLSAYSALNRQCRPCRTCTHLAVLLGRGFTQSLRCCRAWKASVPQNFPVATGYCATHPPSTIIACLVTKEAASEPTRREIRRGTRWTTPIRRAA